MANLRNNTDADQSIQPSDKLSEQYRQGERKFLTLAQDVHLPPLDIKIIEKYFIKVKTAQRLEHLKLVNDALEQHRLATIRILKLVGERESILKTIKQKAADFSARKLSTLEAQSTVLHLLYQHQQLSLSIIEGIFLWRESLTRPYPFQVHGENYLRKIVSDCAQLESSSLKTILPLRLGQFPLCSNISALKMFAQKPSAAAANGAKEARPPHAAVGSLTPSRGGGGGGGGATPGKGARPPGASSRPSQQKGSNNDDDGNQELTGRLRAAESVLFAEKKLQLRLMRELVALAEKGQFVLLLHLPDIIPNCGTAIQITDESLGSQLKESMQAALKHAEQDDPQPDEDVDHEDDDDERSPARGAHASPARHEEDRATSSPATSPASTRPSSPASSHRSSAPSTPHKKEPEQKTTTGNTAQDHHGPRVPSPTHNNDATTSSAATVNTAPKTSAYDDEFEDDD